MKKFLSLILTLTLIATMSAVSFANESQENNAVIIMQKTDAEVDAELQQQIDLEISKITGQGGISTRGNGGSDPNNWKTEYGTTRYITLGGYAGNQYAGGTRFPTGGGFYFQDYGGPDVSASVNFGSGFFSGSISVSLGTASSTGKFVTVPSTSYYYKLYVSKVVKAQPYTVYQKVNGYWQVYYQGYSQSTYSVSAYAARV